ncbi:MAG: type II toxin-antitoxin system HipA family toxin [Rhodospirillaceae bacterium]
MANNRRAEVRFKGFRAGILEQNADRSSIFAYDPHWPDVIACALPRVPNIHAWPDGLHPVFQHTTAEGWLRERQARVSALDIDDDLGLLLRYGRDCIGAISVHPLDQQPPEQHPNLDAVTKAAVDSLRTISGVQKKLLLQKTRAGFVPAGPDGPAPYIGKFNNDDIPTFVRNEALTLSLARELLGADQVTASEAGTVDGFGQALIVERFDRTKDDQKLRLEDLAQVLAKPRGADNGYKYDASFEEAGRAISQYSSRPEIDLLRFYKLVIANGLLGNCDAHLKNFSLLEKPEGLRLAPAYDLVNTVVYHSKGYSTRFALRIDGADRPHDQLTKALFETLGKNLGLSDRVIASAFLDLEKAVANVRKRLRDALTREREPGFISDYEQIVSSAIARILP